MGGGLTAAPKPIYELVKELAPWYMSIGIGYDEYWHGDPERLPFYREAETLRRRRENEMMWLQGLYVYRAIGAFAPVLVSFPAKNAKVGKYGDVIPLTEEERKEQELAQARAEYLRMIDYMNSFARQQGSGEEGGQDG